MIDSFTIFSKSGVILYHYDQRRRLRLQQQQPQRGQQQRPTSGASSIDDEDDGGGGIAPDTVKQLNAFISSILLDSNRSSKLRKTKRVALSTMSSNGVAVGGGVGVGGVGGVGGAGATVAEWETEDAMTNKKSTTTGDDDDEGKSGTGLSRTKGDWIAVALYPEVVLRRSGGGGATASDGGGGAGSSASSTKWIRALLRGGLREYGTYYDAVTSSSSSSNGASSEGGDGGLLDAPDGTKFDATFRALLKRAEAMGRGGAGGRRGRSSGGDNGVDAGPEGEEDYYDSDVEEDDDENDDPAADEEAEVSGDKNDGGGEDGGEPVDVQAGLARLKQRQQRRGRGGAATSAATTKSSSSSTKTATKKGKEKTVWHDGTAKVTKSALAELDRSKDHAGGGGTAVDGIDAAVADDSRALAEARAAYLPSSDEVPSWEEDEALWLDDDEDDGDDGAGPDSGGGGGWGSSLKGFFDQMSGNKVLTEDDLRAPLEDMQRLLTSKNVASEIAREICDDVQSNLVGKKLASFGRVKTAVRQALEGAVERILRPSRGGREVDLLKSVVSKREGGGGIMRSFLGKGAASSSTTKPYVIVMVGINGVGKSTSLAKIAYYLKSNGCNPLLAACDTFRSGAVEQLNVHAKCLDVPLFHRGYAKDPSAVAKAAVDRASQEGNDVVLVDTAGRMQNNVPLMKALSKLVVENNPDLVLFVCEALVGNDGIDQLSMFNKALRTGGHARQIDGIVLTKFDTVSDKVGAALTMTHLTGAPVVFVGTGQKYNHLRKLSVQSVIKSLFS